MKPAPAKRRSDKREKGENRPGRASDRRKRAVAQHVSEKTERGRRSEPPALPVGLLPKKIERRSERHEPPGLVRPVSEPQPIPAPHRPKGRGKEREKKLTAAHVPPSCGARRKRSRA